MAGLRAGTGCNMADQVWVDPEGLLRAVPGLVALGERLDQILSELTARLAAAGPAWGDDAAGRAFEENYLPAADAVISVLSNTRDVLLNTARGVEVMARGYAATEAQNREAIGGPGSAG